MTHAIQLSRVGDDRAKRWTVWMLAVLLSLLAAAQPLRADDAAKVDAKVKADRALDTEPAQWMRFTEDGKGNGKLEVAVGTYKNDAGVTVHLVGAVHVGDRKYYQDLNKRFEGYDVLLYEMVKPAGTGAPVRGQGGGGMVSMFQRLMKDALELEYQLDGVDYSKKNFVHADLDAETFARMQEERGESILGLMLQQMIRDLAKGLDGKQAATKQPGIMELIEAFQSPDSARQLKLLLGRSFNDMEEQMSAFQGTVLLNERNKKALEVLKEAIRSGKKDIGVFYGAAHMPELESRLALMGFKRTGVEYVVAWDISDKEEKVEEEKDAE